VGKAWYDSLGNVQQFMADRARETAVKLRNSGDFNWSALPVHWKFRVSVDHDRAFSNSLRLTAAGPLPSRLIYENSRDTGT
jgi:hypothetical protein